tara:strand:+ start:7983 stop:9227 length:1245 start_codon:yes stop_codon:yes gene_type:complete
MKTRILTLVLGLVSLISYSQKNELKAAEKALKKQDFTTAITAITSAESLIENADSRSKAKFYFLKGKAYMGKKDYKISAEAFQALMTLEKKTRKLKYTSEAQPFMGKMLKEVSERANQLYTNKDYKNAANDFYLTYQLSPVDTIFIYNAAVSSSLAKDYDTALKYYKELGDLGYNGISTLYFAVNKETGIKENLGSKSNRDLYLKSGQYSKPSDEKTESKVGDITKNVAYILKEQGKTDEAIAAIQKARKLYPKDLNLILSEADLYIKLNQLDKFGELMKLAVEQDPTNPTLFFNLGVVSQDKKDLVGAKGYYEKAISLKSDYGDAYTNLAALILEKEKPIIEEMNKNLSDFDKYDELQTKQKAVFKEALPFLEKADKYGRSLSTVRSLMNIYENLAMDAKSKEYRDLYQKLKK